MLLDLHVEKQVLESTPTEYMFSDTRASELLCVDLTARAVSYDGEPVVLGATEFRVLESLARNAGTALSRA